MADIAFVLIRTGFAHNAYVSDVYSRKIFDWNVSPRLTNESLSLQALVVTSRLNQGNFEGLIRHADPDSQHLPLIYSNRLDLLGIQASTGSVGDSYNNGLAETINGLYKSESIRARKPWRSIEGCGAHQLRMDLVVRQLTPAFKTELPTPRRIQARSLQFTRSDDTTRCPRTTRGTKPMAIQ